MPGVLSGSARLQLASRQCERAAHPPVPLPRPPLLKSSGWLEVKLEQPGPNPDGIGSWIEVRRRSAITRREITVGGGHASCQLGWWHFGLGDTAKPEIRVIWPDGAVGGWQEVTSNAFYVVERDKPAREWTPN